MSTVTKPILLDETFAEKMNKQNALLEVIAASSLREISTIGRVLKTLPNRVCLEKRMQSVTSSLILG